MVASTPQRLISRPPTEEPDLFASPGMLQLLDSVGNPASLSNVCSRGDILRAPSHAFGPRTKLFKSEAISSILSNPISTRAKRKRTFTDDVEPSDLGEPTLKARQAAMRLLPLLPESCFIDMAGGIKGYNATPAAERQQANLRTLCKAVGRNGDTGVRLATLISKLVDYRHQHHITGDMWPLFPAILSNFAIWLQNNSKKSGATSVAPRCISVFASAAASIKLPVVLESPHLSSVPAHQSSGDGYTGFVPLDIIHAICQEAQRTSEFYSGLKFDACLVYTMWEGSCRTEDWVKVNVHNKDLAPGAASVYKIAITKNKEKNTLFAVGHQGVTGFNNWRTWFDAQLLEFGASPRLSSNDYSNDCRPLHKTKLDAKDLAKRIFSYILRVASKLGYSEQDLKSLHIHVHALHGSMAAYAEAMEWDRIPKHRLGRWKIPSSDAAVVPVRQKRGAGIGGPKDMPAVYSTAASCQIQLALRCRMVAAIRVIGADFTTHGDLSCFISNPKLYAEGFRGPKGHEVKFVK